MSKQFSRFDLSAGKKNVLERQMRIAALPRGMLQCGGHGPMEWSGHCNGSTFITADTEAGGNGAVSHRPKGRVGHHVRVSSGKECGFWLKTTPNDASESRQLFRSGSLLVSHIEDQPHSRACRQENIEGKWNRTRNKQKENLNGRHGRE